METVIVDSKNFEVVNSGTEHSFIKGCFGNRYRDACANEAQRHKDDPCPPELARTETINIEGFKCKVYYNYVPPYNYGIRPMNVWWGYAESPDGQYWWKCPLKEEIKTLEDACKVILPLFAAIVKKWKKKNESI